MNAKDAKCFMYRKESKKMLQIMAREKIALVRLEDADEF